MKVKMLVKFMDWKKGETVELPKDRVAKYIAMGVCSPITTRKKAKAAPRNKMVTGAANK